MAMKLIDSDSGLEITGTIKLVFVCDMCGNTTEYYNGMSTYSKVTKDTVSRLSYCSEICARKAGLQHG